MEYTTLGDTGIKVSRIWLGCMSFGSSDWRDWVLDEDESRESVERAIDLRINFFDTANMYSRGESEHVLGNVLSEYDSDWPVVATKGYFPTDDENPNARASPEELSSRSSRTVSIDSEWILSTSIRSTDGITRHR